MPEKVSVVNSCRILFPVHAKIYPPVLYHGLQLDVGRVKLSKASDNKHGEPQPT